MCGLEKIIPLATCRKDLRGRAPSEAADDSVEHHPVAKCGQQHYLSVLRGAFTQKCVIVFEVQSRSRRLGEARDSALLWKHLNGSRDKCILVNAHHNESQSVSEKYPCRNCQKLHTLVNNDSYSYYFQLHARSHFLRILQSLTQAAIAETQPLSTDSASRHRLSLQSLKCCL